MGKLLKPGRVVIVTSGRMAGKKGIIVNANESGNKSRPFPHALVAGVERGPRKIHKRMGKRKMNKRCSVKAFIKFINFNHLFPTRYQISQDCINPASLVQEHVPGKEGKGADKDKKGAEGKDEAKPTAVKDKLQDPGFKRSAKIHIRRVLKEK
eukprot:GHVU01067955.1.p1 GENE.GHVU01067955.1~~GHVU01067955.1.p1  ORF type:complete len:153 (+),score=23.56 GHVU01067955.1:313-771(+)